MPTQYVPYPALPLVKPCSFAKRLRRMASLNDWVSRRVHALSDLRKNGFVTSVAATELLQLAEVVTKLAYEADKFPVLVFESRIAQFEPNCRGLFARSFIAVDSAFRNT